MTKERLQRILSTAGLAFTITIAILIILMVCGGFVVFWTDDPLAIIIVTAVVIYIYQYNTLYKES
jgi:membrane protein YdbS with pleckstrin-like domain